MDATDATELVLVYDFADVPSEIGENPTSRRFRQSDATADGIGQCMNGRLLHTQASEHIEPFADLQLVGVDCPKESSLGFRMVRLGRSLRVRPEDLSAYLQRVAVRSLEE